jgi:hypothetical protein
MAKDRDSALKESERDEAKQDRQERADPKGLNRLVETVDRGEAHHEPAHAEYPSERQAKSSLRLFHVLNEEHL